MAGGSPRETPALGRAKISPAKEEMPPRAKARTSPRQAVEAREALTLVPGARVHLPGWTGPWLVEGLAAAASLTAGSGAVLMAARARARLPSPPAQVCCPPPVSPLLLLSGYAGRGSTQPHLTHEKDHSPATPTIGTNLREPQRDRRALSPLLAITAHGSCGVRHYSAWPAAPMRPPYRLCSVRGERHDGSLLRRSQQPGGIRLGLRTSRQFPVPLQCTMWRCTPI